MKIEVRPLLGCSTLERRLQRIRDVFPADDQAAVISELAAAIDALEKASPPVNADAEAGEFVAISALLPEPR